MELVMLYLLAGVLGLAATYVVVRVAVAHGTRGALREHEMWMRDGSMETTLARHYARNRDAD